MNALIREQYMTIQKAVELIQKNWDKLPRSEHYSQETPLVRTLSGTEALWLGVTDHGSDYEIEQEWIGVSEEGVFIWAYASGCSCWDGDYEIHETHDPKEIKAFKFHHKENLKTDWEKKIVDFAETLSPTLLDD
jgi:hypothetical protein